MQGDVIMFRAGIECLIFWHVNTSNSGHSISNDIDEFMNVSYPVYFTDTVKLRSGLSVNQCMCTAIMHVVWFVMCILYGVHKLTECAAFSGTRV